MRKSHEAVRGRTNSGIHTPVLSCRVRLQIPQGIWLGDFTRAHPEVHLEVTGRMELERGTTLFDVEVHSTENGGWAEELRAFPGISGVELLGSHQGCETCRVCSVGPTFVPLFKRHRLIQSFPFPVENGEAIWSVVGVEPKVRALLGRLAEEHTPVQIDSVRRFQAPVTPPLLTRRQQGFLQRALSKGYFEVPRRISLTELARQEGVAISTMSVALALIEKRLVENHVARVDSLSPLPEMRLVRR